MRSRSVSRPWSRCRLTLSTPPSSRANASRRARSSSSGFQFMRFLRRDGLVIIIWWYRQRFPFHPTVEDISVSALEQAADRDAQLHKLRRDVPVQPLLVIHSREQTDRDAPKGLVLRRPYRHGEAVDVRPPQAAGHDVTVLAQKAAVVLETRPQQFGVVRTFALHFGQQCIAATF